ncbi:MULTISPECIES: type II toxin-antitoxin system HicB family antitoxin [unclassified Janthinobacterium]|uniref:type II toxin-antitoxin system HicB family antitoxin n=1 Tax=unclassified Janthinobacterium TaxID=2610881 RepID=UPI000C16629A|nr:MULTISPECIES: type II toxin-antitoxin system HicB family antitoxin [unclassified Janthinobacterium]MDO8069090.1 type II toxin-antitoxin system HicB family antitoxin [Janthinobacterium sp. SUN206]PIF09630.1 putative RNase H-like HicB family nuclease [Janthinobacterium sp. 13]
MNIPVVIFKDADSVYGVNVPDIKGVHSWGDSVEDALNNVRSAITSHIETLLELGEPVEITQSKIEALQANLEHAGGIWALVHLDLEKLDSKPERINISLPRFVLSKIDRYAAARHETRSGLLSRAALSLIEAEAKGGGAR